MKIIGKNDTKFMFPEIKDTINQNIQDYQCNYDENGFVYYTLRFDNPLEKCWEFEFYLLERAIEYTAEDFVKDLEDYYADFSDGVDSFIEKYLSVNDGIFEPKSYTELVEKIIDILQFEKKQVETLIEKLWNDIDNCDDLQKFRRV
ncbi:MAG TPA: YebC/PmpR family DNA-binding transcriptional regulator [Oscillospiraceae bacterium]|nr:YebC/PmpR family DNA-binding transcriptional regulator [Oscillospiraceae bacterium]